MYGNVYIASLRLGGRKLPRYELMLRLLGVATMYGQILGLMNKKNSSENYFRFWKSYAVIMKQILRKRSALLCVQTCVCVYLQNNKKRAKAKTCEGFFFFCEESGCVHCRAAKFAEMILLWTRLRPWLWKLPLEVTVL